MTGPDVLTADGYARLLSRPCDTCVTFPDDRMFLGEHREEFIQTARERGAFIVCHDTTDTGAAAICRGFYNLHRHDSTFLSLGERLGRMQEVEPPEEGILDRKAPR